MIGTHIRLYVEQILRFLPLLKSHAYHLTMSILIVFMCDLHVTSCNTIRNHCFQMTVIETYFDPVEQKSQHIRLYVTFIIKYVWQIIPLCEKYHSYAVENASIKYFKDISH